MVGSLLKAGLMTAGMGFWMRLIQESGKVEAVRMRRRMENGELEKGGREQDEVDG